MNKPSQKMIEVDFDVPKGRGKAWAQRVWLHPADPRKVLMNGGARWSFGKPSDRNPNSIQVRCHPGDVVRLGRTERSGNERHYQEIHGYFLVDASGRPQRIAEGNTDGMQALRELEREGRWMLGQRAYALGLAAKMETDLSEMKVRYRMTPEDLAQARAKRDNPGQDLSGAPGSSPAGARRSGQETPDKREAA